MFKQCDEALYDSFAAKGQIQSPLFTALSLGLGFATFGPQGVLFGPLLVCLLNILLVPDDDSRDGKGPNDGELTKRRRRSKSAQTLAPLVQRPESTTSVGIAAGDIPFLHLNVNKPGKVSTMKAHAAAKPDLKPNSITATSVSRNSVPSIASSKSSSLTEDDFADMHVINEIEEELDEEEADLAF